jgi:hypothetical protein
VLDIVHPLALAQEISNDLSLKTAVGQADIKAYYDSIDMLKVVLQIMKWGVSPVIAQAIMRIHMCPPVLNVTGDTGAPIGPRSKGILTGSHTGGLIGRVPWLDVLHKVHHLCADLSASFGGTAEEDPTCLAPNGMG